MTPRQEEFLEFINSNEGLSIQELGKHFGISPSTAYNHLRVLREEGYLVCRQDETGKFGWFRGIVQAMKAPEIPLVNSIFSLGDYYRNLQ